jgi:hypothetical protein
VICTNRGGRNQQIGLSSALLDYNSPRQGRGAWSIGGRWRCDGEDFVIAVQPEDEIVFRTKDARALRNLCRRLRWQIAIDTTLSIDDWTWPPGSGGAPRKDLTGGRFQNRGNAVRE